MSGRALLVLNAGSSSIKFRVYHLVRGDLEGGLYGQIEGIGTAHPKLQVHEGGSKRERELSTAEAGTPEAATALLAQAIAQRSAELEIVAVGHRIVHGGTRYGAPVRIDDSMIDYLQHALNPLAAAASAAQSRR